MFISQNPTHWILPPVEARMRRIEVVLAIRKSDVELYFTYFKCRGLARRCTTEVLLMGDDDVRSTIAVTTLFVERWRV